MNDIILTITPAMIGIGIISLAIGSIELIRRVSKRPVSYPGVVSVIIAASCGAAAASII